MDLESLSFYLNRSRPTDNPISQLNPAQDSDIISVKPGLQDAISSVTTSADFANSLHRIFIIGGASVYKSTLESASSDNASQSTVADRILMTRVLSPRFEDCDVFFPEFREMKAKDGTPLWMQTTHDELETWVGGTVPKGTQQEKGIEYEFQMWIRKE